MSNLFPTYARWEIEPESASGSQMIDKNGKKEELENGINIIKEVLEKEYMSAE
ncbi:hypothetical protein J7E79_21455 [Bacillus sp. ISL-40]|uniref:hypothetical protein n=1 Tax=unclassified Bacillus (in: firmicutes) TaxID=185979 RepID=UPI001BE577C9|nr:MULTISPECIES: hypothetical protein [unclassified Bacillus (in: firmicutes)]MBT2699935.1 hypothetical protein [Bacillus sp. ISL-40]MBT2722954.1 hypothetical protein [Bacillus sp. ISL-46]MBT2743760.1 hypothetical protein [Bacillus sp. ISL-77]